MRFKIITTTIDKKAITDFADKGDVFVFPGNPSHHGSGARLDTKKNGGGLAEIAGIMSDQDILTWSLPTTGMPQHVNAMAHDAVCHLWYAVGLGLIPLLSVRPHKNSTYFPMSLNFNTTSEDKWEPSFWGGIETIPNLRLAAFYLTEIQRIIDFLDFQKIKDEKETITETKETKLSKEFPAAYQAYKAGQQQKSAEQAKFFKREIQVQDSKTEEHCWFSKSEIAKFQQTICAKLDEYCSLWFWFTRNHRSRAQAVKKSILACNSYEEIKLVIDNQLNVLQGLPQESSSTLLQQQLGSRFMDTNQLKNKNRPSSPSQYFQTISEINNELEKKLKLDPSLSLSK